MDTPIYLDHAAATPLDPLVLEAMEPFLTAQFYNPSAIYEAAKHVRRSLEKARSQVAYWLGAQSSEIIFTAGATEANNLAISGIMRAHPKGRIVCSAIEHASVLLTAQQYDCAEVSVRSDGIIDPDALSDAIDERTVLVSIMYANNEIGTVQPIREIGLLLERRRRERAQKGNSLPLFFHCDAAQAANYLDLHVARLGVDLLSLNGSKMYGPKQSGVLFVKAGVELKPFLLGGGQERGIRSGTENVAGSIGLATALDRAQEMRHTEAKRLGALQKRFISELSELPGAEINGSLSHRLPNNVHVSFAAQDNERLLFGLELAGILAAVGSACSASDDEPSHVLKAIGLSDAEARSSLRFTMGRSTSEHDLEKTILTLSQLLHN